MDQISRQVDDYEDRYGECDRSEFDGEFVVPADVRSRMNNLNKGSLRIHGGLLTLTRSRTFFTLTSTTKSSIHSSTPDLSRTSIPNTPGSSHKLSLTSSYDSVLEENEEDGVMVIKKGGKDKNKKSSHHVQHIFDNAPIRRKSEDFLDAQTRNGGNTMKAVEMQQKHVRQSSDQAYRLIPRVKNPISDAPQPPPRKHSVEFLENSSINRHNATTSLNNEMINNYSRWGNVRASNSFAADLNVSNISSYSIPRVSLSHHQRAHSNEPTKTSSISRKSIIAKHEFRDSHK